MVVLSELPRYNSIVMRWLVILLSLTLLAADEREGLQRARTAFAKQQYDAALRALEPLRTTSDDPGRLAYDRGVILAAAGEYRAAELEFLRCLADDAAPAERVRRATYNRGVCILHHARTARVVRVAIECFETVVKSNADDAAFTADAKHNLQLAKLKWVELSKQEAKTPKPNDRTPEEPETRERPNDPPMNDPQTNENPGPQATQAKPGPTNAAPGAGQSSDQTQPGQGTLAPLPDNEQIIKRTPEDTRTYLRKAAERLEKERRSNAELLAGPDRKGVRDW